MKRLTTAAIAASFAFSLAVIAFGAEMTAPPASPSPPAAPPAAAQVKRPIPARPAQRSPNARWNSLTPREQQELLENYEIWKTMPPERRERLKKAYRIFNSLTPAKRQELRNKYNELKNLPPEKREKVKIQLERWRRMTPQERQAYRDGINKFNALPPDKKEEVRAKLRALKDLPPEEQKKRREEIRVELKQQGIIIPPKEPVTPKPASPR